MSTEKFTRQEFEDTLLKFIQSCDLVNTKPWVAVDHQGLLVQGEYRYRIVANVVIPKGPRGSQLPKNDKFCVYVVIASSVDVSGYAQDTGDNSIRLWLTGEDGLPLGNKISRWVTRVPGWQERVADQLERLVAMAQAIRWCAACNTTEKIFVVKKEGPNKGRLFLKCNCGKFTWVGDERDENAPTQPVAADKAPACPKCGGRMAKRNGSKGPFWGCTLYPACKGTLDIKVESKSFSANAQELAKSVVEDATKLVELPQTDKAWSKYQLAIFNWVLAGKGKNLVVEAVPGSGKTTVGVEMLHLVPHSQTILFLAFNKHIAMELSKRVNLVNCRVSTYHSCGFKAVRNAFGSDIKVDDDKARTILMGILWRDTYGGLYPAILKLVALVKANLLDGTDADLEFLADRHGVELNGDGPVVFQAVRSVLERCKAMTNVVDYDDMCWLPVVLDLPCERYDFLFIDEAQDTNRCQLALAMKCIKPSGRIVAVGDRHQSLYGFRGADVDAIPNLITGLAAETLPLSVTYRCPKVVVKLLNEKFPDIPFEAAPSAIDGEYRQITENKADAEYTPGDMVLCRTNAPLVQPAFALIRRGVKAIIRGRDIGKGLTTLIKKMDAPDLPTLLAKLTVYCDNEVAKLTLVDKTSQAQAVQDKVDTLVALSDGILTIYELENRIDTIFSDEQIGVVFSSVHRAKGLEAKRVYILKPELMPHPMAKQAWEREQERNIEWVAKSRALAELVIVGETK